MTAYQPLFSSALPSDLEPGAEPWAVYRATLDLPFRLRVFGVRSYLLAASGVITRDAAMRTAAVESLREAIKGYDTLAAALLDPATVLAHHPRSVALIEAARAAEPASDALIRDLRDRIATMTECLATGGTIPPAAFDDAMRYAYDAFTPAMVALTAHMEAASRVERARNADAARAAHDDAQGAVAQIARIARTVRLISVNAHVEAARSGEAGRTFGVIASEIKTLSEQTAQASRVIGASVATLMKGRGAV